MSSGNPTSRRKFVKRCLMGGCALALAGYTLKDFTGPEKQAGLRVGFRNDGPDRLWEWSREAMWYETTGNLVKCTLCPHNCTIRSGGRGACAVRYTEAGRLYTLVYDKVIAREVNPVYSPLISKKRISRKLNSFS